MKNLDLNNIEQTLNVSISPTNEIKKESKRIKIMDGATMTNNNLLTKDTFQLKEIEDELKIVEYGLELVYKRIEYNNVKYPKFLVFYKKKDKYELSNAHLSHNYTFIKLEKHIENMKNELEKENCTFTIGDPIIYKVMSFVDFEITNFNVSLPEEEKMLFQLLSDSSNPDISDSYNFTVTMINSYDGSYKLTKRVGLKNKEFKNLLVGVDKDRNYHNSKLKLNATKIFDIVNEVKNKINQFKQITIGQSETEYLEKELPAKYYMKVMSTFESLSNYNMNNLYYLTIILSSQINNKPTITTIDSLKKIVDNIYHGNI